METTFNFDASNLNLTDDSSEEVTQLKEQVADAVSSFSLSCLCVQAFLLFIIMIISAVICHVCVLNIRPNLSFHFQQLLEQLGPMIGGLKGIRIISVRYENVVDISRKNCRKRNSI